MNTLRLYDAEFIAKLSVLMEKGKYRNRNEFLTEILKLGYESRVAPAKYAGATCVIPDSSVAAQEITHGAGTPDTDSDKDAYTLISQMNNYMILQFKVISLYQEVYQKMLSAIYRMQLSQSGGEKVAPASVEAGYFDDLPVRFEGVIADLKTKLGLLL